MTVATISASTHCAQVVSGVAVNNPHSTTAAAALAHASVFLSYPVIPSTLHAHKRKQKKTIMKFIYINVYG